VEKIIKYVFHINKRKNVYKRYCSHICLSFWFTGKAWV